MVATTGTAGTTASATAPMPRASAAAPTRNTRPSSHLASLRPRSQEPNAQAMDATVRARPAHAGLALTVASIAWAFGSWLRGRSEGTWDGERDGPDAEGQCGGPHPEHAPVVPLALASAAQPGAERPGDGRDRRGKAGVRRPHAALGGEQQGQVHLGTEEGGTEQAPQRDHAGQPAGQPKGAGRQQSGDRDGEQRQPDDAGDQGDRGVLLATPVQRQRGHAGADPAQQTLPPDATAAADRRRGAGVPGEDRAQGGKGGNGEDRDGQEHPPPTDALREPAGHRRPDEGGHNPGRREGREDPRLDALRVGVADDDVQGEHERAAAKTLDGPTGDDGGLIIAGTAS